MYKYLYIEINILCILILLYILYRMTKNDDQQSVSLFFKRVIATVLIALCCDCIWILVDGRALPPLYICNRIVNAVFLFLTGFMSHQWFFFAESKLGCKKFFSRTARILLAIPLLVLFIVSLASIWTNWLFFIDAGNVYHRGPLHFVQLLVSYFYLISSSCHVLLCIKNARSYHERMEMLSLLLFFILPAAGGIVSASVYGLPTLLPFATLSLLMVFINFQSYQISTDGLTGLNNRRRFDTYLQNLVSDPHRTGHLFLLLLDIDLFKSINDTYGHFEGDRALVETASLLKSVCSRRDIFLARYGGDEFAIIYSSNDSLGAQKLKEEINHAFLLRSQSASAQYNITLSIGTEEYAPDHAPSIPDLISGADRALYREKARFKIKKNFSQP